MNAQVEIKQTQSIVRGFAAVIPADERNAMGEPVAAWALPGGRITYSMEEAIAVAERMSSIMPTGGLVPSRNTTKEAVEAARAAVYPIQLYRMFRAIGTYDEWTVHQKGIIKTLRQCLAAA